MSACLFCDLFRAFFTGESRPESLEYMGNQVYRLVPLNPVVEGHQLFIPENHVQHAAADPDTTARTMLVAARYARDYPMQPFNLITSAGYAATQTVMHLHIHYVPRRSNDGLHLPWTEKEEDSHE